MSGSPFLSVVIPVFRSERILPVLNERLVSTLSGLGEFEIIYVDDRSPDRSWNILKDLAAKTSNITAVRLSRNFGQHYAITAGMDMARGEWVVVMDCDLQDRPEEIPRMLEKARDGFDVVMARRCERSDTLLKRFSSWSFFKVFGFLSGADVDSKVGTFRLMRRPVVKAFSGMRENFRFFTGMVDWLGFERAFIDVRHDSRYEGKSSYTVRKLLKLAMDGIVSFSNRPLYASVILGLFVSAFAGIYGVYLLILGLFFGGTPVPGWLTTVTLQSFIGGMILVNLGIIGIYIGRIYEQTKQRPYYVIDQILRSDGETLAREWPSSAENASEKGVDGGVAGPI